MNHALLVAHRGQPLTFPENSLQGYAHVLQAGAQYIETDINFTADDIPVLSHDDNLLKLCSQSLQLADITYAEVKQLSAGYPDRFGDQFSDYRIGTLTDLSDLLHRWPDATCFVELKSSNMNSLGNRAIDLICQSISHIAAQAVLISFNYQALEYAKQHHDFPIGWVLPGWDDENQTKANALAPDYLLADVAILPKKKSLLWQGKWRWAAYVVNNTSDYNTYTDMGIGLIETDRYSELAKELASELTSEPTDKLSQLPIPSGDSQT